MAYTKKAADQLKTQNVTNNTNNKNDSTRIVPASTTVMFKRVSAPTSESELQNLDLNVVSDVRRQSQPTTVCVVSSLTHSLWYIIYVYRR